MPAEAEPTPARTRRADASLAEDQGLVARLAARGRAFKDALKRAREDLALAKTDIQARDARIAELQPLADGSKAEALAAELRTLKHRGRFDAIAGELGVRPGAVEDLYALSGYKPEADTVDDAAIRAAIDGQKTARPYLFGGAEAEATSGDSTPTPTLAAGPGSGRGGSTAAPPARYTEAQLSDPAFVMRNWEANVQQAKDTLERGFGR